MRIRILKGFWTSGLGLTILGVVFAIFLTSIGLFTFYYLKYSRMIDARLSGIEVLKPPVIDFTPVDPVAFWKASRVLTPDPVGIVDEWMPLEGRDWRSVELAGPSRGPGTHPGSARLMASAHIHRRPDPAVPSVILVHGYADVDDQLVWMW